MTNYHPVPTDDVLYMRRALELASLGRATARPNPMVGAVVVHQGRIIGEGYHHAWGEPHAEVMAVRSVANEALLPSSVMYVTLEPCSHYGKTPPCTELIIRLGIRKVFVAMADPYPEVAGRGIEMLRSAGITVEVGLLADEARQLNAPFVWAYTLGRPYISLKWAQSADGYMDAHRENAQSGPVIFSSGYRQRLVHRARLEHQAILVGYRTALLDNPSLTNRYWGAVQPIRLILDPRLALPSDLKVKTDGRAVTFILYDPRYVQPEASHGTSSTVRYLPMNYEQGIPQGLCTLLHAEGIQSVLIEGGASTLAEFIKAECYDHIEVEHASITLGSGVAAPSLSHPADQID